jgi:hypothetical protein
MRSKRPKRLAERRYREVPFTPFWSYSISIYKNPARHSYSIHKNKNQNFIKLCSASIACRFFIYARLLAYITIPGIKTIKALYKISHKPNYIAACGFFSDLYQTCPCSRDIKFNCNLFHHHRNCMANLPYKSILS